MSNKHLQVGDKTLQCMLQATDHRGPRGIDDSTVRGTQDMGQKTLWLRPFPYIAIALVPSDREPFPQVFRVPQAHKGQLQTAKHCLVVRPL